MSKTLPLHYVEQRADDLAFYLFESPAPRERVQVLAERRLEIPGATITLAIIGSSHFLEIAAGQCVLCEMVACPRPGLEQTPRVAEAAGQRSWQHRWTKDGLSYRFQMRRRRCTAVEFQRVSRTLAALASNRLRYLFPQAGDEGSAVTCLEWRVADRAADITTSHTYPGELTIVETRSAIEVVEAGEGP